MSLELRTYTFHCTWRTDARLPEYLGSTLRGAFGWALKKCSCALKRQECASCVLRPECAYAWIFETEIYAEGGSGKVNARPHPFVIQPHGSHSTKPQAGEPFSFSLLLFGGGHRFMPHIAHSFSMIGEDGIGSGRKFGLGRFQLERITQNTQEIYNSTDRILRRGDYHDVLQADTNGSCGSCRVILLSPLRLKFANKIHQQLPFHLLVRAALRRIAALEEAYSGGEPALDYPGLVKRAETVPTMASTLRWHELHRYSNRQKSEVPLGGIIGDVRYGDEASHFLPILRYAEKVHIGKQTVFGLGRLAIEADA